MHLICCREVRENFCSSGQGKALSMGKFYIWMTLKDEADNLGAVSKLLSIAVSGDGSGYVSSSSEGSGSSANNAKLSRKSMSQAVTMASAVGAVLKVIGGPGTSSKSSALEAAEVLVKQKEAAALDAQTANLAEQSKADVVAKKAASLQALVESKETPPEVRKKAMAAWVALLGIDA